MSEGIDFSRTNGSNECSICHYCYFLELNFRFQSNLCNGCDKLLQKALSFNDCLIVSFTRNYQKEYNDILNKANNSMKKEFAS